MAVGARQNGKVIPNRFFIRAFNFFDFFHHKFNLIIQSFFVGVDYTIVILRRYTPKDLCLFVLDRDSSLRSE